MKRFANFYGNSILFLSIWAVIVVCCMEASGADVKDVYFWNQTTHRYVDSVNITVDQDGKITSHNPIRVDARIKLTRNMPAELRLDVYLIYEEEVVKVEEQIKLKKVSKTNFYIGDGNEEILDIKGWQEEYSGDGVLNYVMITHQDDGEWGIRLVYPDGDTQPQEITAHFYRAIGPNGKTGLKVNNASIDYKNNCFDSDIRIRTRIPAGYQDSDINNIFRPWLTYEKEGETAETRQSDTVIDINRIGRTGYYYSNSLNEYLVGWLNEVESWGGLREGLVSVTIKDLNENEIASLNIDNSIKQRFEMCFINRSSNPPHRIVRAEYDEGEGRFSDEIELRIMALRRLENLEIEALAINGTDNPRFTINREEFDHSDRGGLHIYTKNLDELGYEYLDGLRFLFVKNPNGLESAFLTVQRTNTGTKSVIDEIRKEATRKNTDSNGRPLPLAGHWNTGKFLIDLIKQGHHILPNLDLLSHVDRKHADLPVIRQIAKENLPFSITGTQWEWLLATDSQYSDIDKDSEGNFNGTNASESNNPLFINKLDNRIERMLSPFGPQGQIDLWRQVGERWGDTPALRKAKQWYPEPPKVLFVSNNETIRLSWQYIDNSKRYRELYSDQECIIQDSGEHADAIEEFRRYLLFNGWRDRYSALIEGFRGILGESWKDNSVFLGYKSFGPEYLGKFPNCFNEYSIKTYKFDFDGNSFTYTLEPNIAPWPYSFEGGSPMYFLSGGTRYDNRLSCPQIELMNFIFMLNEIYEYNPEFWFELTIWDGENWRYRDWYPEGFPPDRYEGLAQFGAWLLRPRVMREYRYSNQSYIYYKDYFMAICNVVEKIYNNPILKFFWRHGKLVENRSMEHPYYSLKDGYRDEEIIERYGVGRWFLLDTIIDGMTYPAKIHRNPIKYKPQGSSTSYEVIDQRQWFYTNCWVPYVQSEIPIYSIALVLGEEPYREYLVYAHSPLGNSSNVMIRIPDYGDITVDVKQKGSFFQVKENGDVVDVLEEPRLVSISIIPEVTVMGVDQERQFKAIGKDLYGNTYQIDPSWAASDGNIDSTGLYISPKDYGHYIITVSKDGIEGTAIVNVSEILAHWTFDEDSGFVVMDEAGCSDNDAYLSDSLFCDDDISGTAIEFNNSGREVGNYDYLSAYTNSFSQQPISISLWVHPISSNGLIIGYHDDKGYHGWGLSMNGAQSVKFSLIDDTGNSLSPVWTSNTSLLNAWHHIVVTDDGTELKIYIDGNEKGTALSTTALYADEMQISMGVNKPNTQWASLPYTGKIDDVRIYSKALSQEDVKELYDSCENPWRKK